MQRPDSEHQEMRSASAREDQCRIARRRIAALMTRRHQHSRRTERL